MMNSYMVIDNIGFWLLILMFAVLITAIFYANKWLQAERTINRLKKKCECYRCRNVELESELYKLTYRTPEVDR